MQRKLHKAGLLVIVLAFSGLVLAGCVDEPNPPVIEKVTASVRFVHAVSDGPAVDIWSDGNKIKENISFKGYTPYLEINAGDRFIRITPTGQDTSKAIFRQRTSFRSFTKMTMVFFGLAANDNVGAVLTQERFTYSDETAKLVDSADVKLINVNAGEVPIVLVDGTTDGISGKQLIGGPINSGGLSAYVRIAAGTYKFYVGTSGVEVTNKSFELKNKTRYSFILVGSAATPENSELLTLQDDPN